MLYQAGINFIDAAETYASGTSEHFITDLIKDLPRDKYVIQTKWVQHAQDSRQLTCTRLMRL
jgi:aryl-alcohol dehydrogenase-like predicted oxidoreductase